MRHEDPPPVTEQIYVGVLLALLICAILYVIHWLSF